jgi:hypothetical protein
MQTSQQSLAAALPLPEVDTDEPVAVIPAASVAPLDGPPDGERINIYTLAPRQQRSLDEAMGDALEDLRARVLTTPLKSVALAFSLGYLYARLFR